MEFIKYHIAGFTVHFMEILFKLLLFKPFTSNKLIQKIILTFSIFGLFGVLLAPFFFMRVEDAGKIIIIVDTVVYVVKVGAHMTALVEVISFYDVGKRLQKTILELDEDIALKLYQKMKSLHSLNTDIYFDAFLMILFIALNYFIIVTTDLFYEYGTLNRFSWFSFFSAIACKVRMVQVIVDLTKIKIRINNFHEAISKLNKVRRPLVLTNKKASYNDLKMEQILTLKIIYDKIFSVCENINNCYGSSLLAIVASGFVDITSNCYQIFLFIVNGQGNLVEIVYSSCVILQMVVIIWILCWRSQQCSEKPAEIGTALMQLESLDYGQEYSSLLSEFSLQIIHQPIYITARRFLTFNLNFLSSMFAAIVTYLVIIIQFFVNAKSGVTVKKPYV